MKNGTKTKRILSLGWAVAIAALLSSCATPYYTKVNFCWTTTHRIPPQQRFLQVPGRADDVTAALKKWVSESGGRVTSVAKPEKMLRPAGNADILFQELTTIVSKEWQAYDLNRPRAMEDGEWQRMKDLSIKQIEETELLVEAYRIDAVLGMRSGKTTTRVAVGKTATPVYTKGFTAYRASGGGIQAIKVPGHVLAVPETKYENRQKTGTFESRMQFYVFAGSENSCTVYVHGAPADRKSDTVAQYGASIGRAWWPYVTGEHEARLARDAFDYLSRSFAAPRPSTSDALKGNAATE